LAFAKKKIIGGELPELDHPGFYNTLALVKADGKIFCTGALISKNLIVTAKHCLADKKIEDFKLYFGPDTNNPIEENYRTPLAFKVRKLEDWQMTFPSFDIAWVTFDGDIPEGYQPLPVLTDHTQLETDSIIHQVGFGNHSAQRGKIEAGLRLTGQTILKEYINSPRFFHILLFDGQEGQGSCHGDSGGPAYSFINGQWYVVGVTNGFDVVLTPETMTRTGDPDFPYNVDCSKNQSLYSFIGAHGKWIEHTSDQVVYKSAPFENISTEDPKEANSVLEWCQSSDIGSPSWNLLKVILDQKIDKMPQEEGKNFYEDCDLISQYLFEIKDVNLDHGSVIEASFSFKNLKLLPNLKTLSIRNFPREKVLLETIEGLNLKSLNLSNNGIKSLQFMAKNSIENLILEKNPIFSLSGIEKVEDLRELDISSTPIRDLKILKETQIKSLKAVGLSTAVVVGLDALVENIETLDLRNTLILNNDVFKDFKNLKDLSLTGDIGEIDLTFLNHIERLNLSAFKEDSIKFPKNLSALIEINANNCSLSDLNFLETALNLEEINLTFNRISSIEVFGKNNYPHLRELNLSVNPILNVSPLRSLDSIDVLRLFRTPLARNLVPKTEENCPTQNTSKALSKFCSN